jgi:hypothetical protein
MDNEAVVYELIHLRLAPEILRMLEDAYDAGYQQGVQDSEEILDAPTVQS